MSFYQPKRFNNPYFRKRKNPKPSRFYYNLFLLSVAILGWFYFLFASSIFQITDWEIYGPEKYNEQEVEKTVKDFFNNRKFLFFRFSNIILFNKNDLEKHLSSKFIFNNIEVQKYYPHKIILNLQEKQEKFAVYNDNKVFIVADDGTIIMEKQGIAGWYQEIAQNTNATSTKDANVDIQKILADAETKSLPNYPIFCDAYYRGGYLEVGKDYPAKDIIQIATSFIDNLSQRANINTRAVVLYKNKINPKIIVYTTNNWKIYLNNTDDGLKQFYKLFLVYNNEIKDPNKPLEYIDLRFGDRVYIK